MGTEHRSWFQYRSCSSRASTVPWFLGTVLVPVCTNLTYLILSPCVIKHFIIHPCDPTVVICYLIWPCDTTICITYLVSHSYSLTYNLRIFQFGCIINTKLPSCDDIIHRTSLGFPSWCPESTRPSDSCFQAPAVKTS